MNKLVINILLAMVFFAAVSIGAQAAPIESDSDTGPVQFDYREECLSEGCDNEELKELYNSMMHECNSETCWHEEVTELSGGSRYDSAMFEAFRNRLGKTFTITYRTDPRPSDWQVFKGVVEDVGKVVKVVADVVGVVIKVCEVAC